MNCQNMTSVLERNQQSNWSESFELIFVVIICCFVFCEELKMRFVACFLMYFFVVEEMHSNLPVPNEFKQLRKRI